MSETNEKLQCFIDACKNDASPNGLCKSCNKILNEGLVEVCKRYDKYISSKHDFNKFMERFVVFSKHKQIYIYNKLKTNNITINMLASALKYENEYPS